MMFKLQSLVQDKLRHAMDVRQHLKLKKSSLFKQRKKRFTITSTEDISSKRKQK